MSVAYPLVMVVIRRLVFEALQDALSAERV
jgi:hypothetical protein